MTFTSRLPRSTSEAQGVDAGGILAFVEAVESGIEQLHSFMLLRHGHVIAEGWWDPYAAEHPHMMFSLSKSFTSTAVGIAISEGLFELDDRVIDLLPDDAPREIGPRLAELRVRHLLTMTTGHASESLENLERAEQDNWARFILGKPIDFDPGTHFVYNSGASYLLSAIVQRLCGRRIVDYLETRLFEPLGIVGAAWETCPRGINTGGWGLSLRTEDVAAFGQLYLQDGSWGGRQLVPSDWVARATSNLVPNGDPATASDWAQGYGFQFWQCRHGAYRGDGAFGQYCVVMKEQDAVLVMTGGLQDMQVPLDLAWKHLLPALSDAEPSVAEPSVAEPSVAEPVEAPFLNLRILPQLGGVTSPLSAKVAGVTFTLPTCAVTLENSETGSSLTLTLAGIDRKVELGHASWAFGETTPFDGNSRAVAASGAWASDDTFVARLVFYETPFENTIALTFADGKVTIDIAQNVSFDSTHLLHAVGIAQGTTRRTGFLTGQVETPDDFDRIADVEIRRAFEGDE
jgi:CubicO group peptidase (beta-lactamase class C family)